MSRLSPAAVGEFLRRFHPYQKGLFTFEPEGFGFKLTLTAGASSDSCSVRFGGENDPRWWIIGENGKSLEGPFNCKATLRKGLLEWLAGPKPVVSDPLDRKWFARYHPGRAKDSPGGVLWFSTKKPFRSCKEQ